jgi:hypothetical protein
MVAVILSAACSTASFLSSDPPSGCDQGEALGVINKFLTAYNGGEPGTEAFFADDGLFQQFVDPPHRIGDEARDRGTLDAHFAEQHQRGESLTTSAFFFVGYRPADNMGLFDATFERAAGQSIQVELILECGIPMQRGARIVSWVVES